MGDATGLDKIIVNAQPSLHTKSRTRYLKLNVSLHNHPVITRRVLHARDYVQTPSREVSYHSFWVPGVAKYCQSFDLFRAASVNEGIEQFQL